VYPINHKYPEIYGIKTYQGLGELLDTPDNIVFAISPDNNLKSLENLNIDKAFVFGFLLNVGMMNLSQKRKK